MIKVYATLLGLGFLALVIVIYGGAIAENLGKPGRDPGERLGAAGRIAIGAVLGFGIGGISAEFSPLDLSWPIGLLVALIGSALGTAWVRYSQPAADA